MQAQGVWRAKCWLERGGRARGPLEPTFDDVVVFRAGLVEIGRAQIEDAAHHLIVVAEVIPWPSIVSVDQDGPVGAGLDEEIAHEGVACAVEVDAVALPCRGPGHDAAIDHELFNTDEVTRVASKPRRGV